jgi:peptidoglycan-N-acetylglucosamine deacetylase
LPQKFPKTLTLAIGLAGLLIAPAASHADSHAACASDATALPVSRVVEIDATGGPVFGSVTRQRHEPSFLRPKEVVLTFDDGPMPWVTKSILGTLDTFCTKATFFSVGRMALAYPATVKDILARGHTLGSHTLTHPFHMPRMKPDAAAAEIERGLAAVTTAAGTPIAPFFRFTGLADSARLIAYLKGRNIATFTVDAVSNDSYIHDPDKLVQRTMSEVRKNHGGIILFHDIKTTTAKALPRILANLKAEGYSVVHLTAKHSAEPLVAAMQDVSPKYAAPKLANARDDGKQPAATVPMRGAITPETEDGPPKVEVSSVGVAPGTRRDGADALIKSAPLLASTVPKQPGNVKSGTVSTGWTTSSIGEASGPPVIVDTIHAGRADKVPSEGRTSDWITSVQPGRAGHTAKAPH